MNFHHTGDADISTVSVSPVNFDIQSEYTDAEEELSVNEEDIRRAERAEMLRHHVSDLLLFHIIVCFHVHDQVLLVFVWLACHCIPLPGIVDIT